ncbi:MAG: thioesterase [Thermoleophilia bacterium]|nr:MAG: thioesterase [Thermoleophilia bacterium]
MPRRSDFPVFRGITTRWMDNDVYGHVNNVVYYSWFDTTVNAFLIEQGVLDPASGDAVGVVVETLCRYHDSIAFPEPVEAGLRVERIGTSSVRYELGIFRVGAELASADGHFVHVYVDRETRRPVAVPDAVRAVLQPLTDNQP